MKPKRSLIISYALKTKARKIRNKGYQSLDILVRVNSEPLNVVKYSKVTAVIKRIRSVLYPKYWRILRQVFLNDDAVIVRLSGLHFSIDEVKEYIFQRGFRTKMILHYHNWPFGNSGAYDEESFALIKCDKLLLQKLFSRFWFVIGYELRFQVMVVDPMEVSDLREWSKMDNSQTTQNDLISRSLLVFDNQYNGFNFSIISGRANIKLIQNGINKELFKENLSI